MRTSLAGMMVLAMGVLFSAAVCGAPEVRVTVDPAKEGAAVPADFSGVSYEMQLVTPGKDGGYYFSAKNTPLVGMFKGLGIKSLRVGGNTVDKPGVPEPTEADIDELFGFARAAGVKVIYTLRLREGDPAKAAETARFVMGRYRSQVDCIAAGNEPNVYAKTYEEYRDLMKKYYGAITASVPGVKFCGPGATPGKAAWARSYAEEFGPSGQVKLVTQHSYPGGSARKVTNVTKAREQMLSREWVNIYQKMYDAFVPAATKAGMKYRIEETNSFFNGGAKDVSDTLASAVWGLDYMYWWAEHEAAGLNFHTGDNVAAGEELTPCRYAMFRTSDKGYDVHPLGYAVKAFDLGSHGKMVAAKVEGDANVTAYAVKAGENHYFVTVINKETAAVKVTVAKIGDVMPLRTVKLEGPDLSATSGVTLGGGKIADDGTWEGKWTERAGVGGDGSMNLELGIGSAVVVELAVQ